MKVAIDLLFSLRLHNSRERVAREIDEQLSFHVESLTQELLAQDMTPAEASHAAARRFGDVTQIRDECVAISRRSRPALVALKASLIVLFLAGVLVRTLDAGVNVHHLGDVLIAVPTLGGLLVYVRGLSPSRFLSKEVLPSPLGLAEAAQPLFTVYDRRMLTPVERLISDK